MPFTHQQQREEPNKVASSVRPSRTKSIGIPHMLGRGEWSPVVDAATAGYANRRPIAVSATASSRMNRVAAGFRVVGHALGARFLRGGPTIAALSLLHAANTLSNVRRRRNKARSFEADESELGPLTEVHRPLILGRSNPNAKRLAKLFGRK